MIVNPNFGECPICRQGLLLAVRNQASGKLFIMCDDCESQWSSPSEAASFTTALKNEARAVTNASIEEILAAGWGPYVSRI